MALGFATTHIGLGATFDEFVDQVVPELRRRCLFRETCEGATLRDHLGLA